MAQTRLVRVTVVVLTYLLLASAAWAQVATSGIAGVVRDTSGGVLPGVTVEATSPALIEKVRAVVSDDEGRYNIVALQPGTYTVTFTLAGFNTLRREGIVLTAGFTATVNADMPVGALEETVTVTGETPLVDTQNTRQQSQISSALLTLLPSAKAAVTTLVAFTPGVSGNADVGGSTAASWKSQGTTGNIRFHGKAGLDQNYDGFGILGALGTGNTGFMVNPFMVQEIVVEKGMGSSEARTSMLTFNAIPKEGSNIFNFSASGLYSNHSMQGNNLNDTLRAQGIINVEAVDYVYTAGGSAGGPIKRDKLWFHAAAQRLGNHNYEANNYYNKTHGTLIYTPDHDRPGEQLDEAYRIAGRVTWQAATRHKLNFGAELQKIHEHRQRGFTSPEAVEKYRHKMTLLQTSWNSAATNKLLFEAGVSSMFWGLPTYPTPEIPDPANTVGVAELSTGYRYNSRFLFSLNDTWRRAQRFAVSYVTGSHAFKVGVQNEQIINNLCAGCNGPQPHINYEVNRGVPASIVQTARPYQLDARIRAELGLYAQDQWAIKRLTLLYGVRFDYFNGQADEQTIPATRFIPERHYDAVKNIPRWTDVSPRLGVSYDLLGNGRTALKAGLGRYVVKDSVAFVGANNPINTAVNSVRRNWTDANGDYKPDCNLNIFTANGECGPISDAAFGQQKITTRYADDVRQGFGVRPSNWDMSAEVQHQLTRAFSVTGGFYRTVFSHGGSGGLASFVTDNLLVTPADYDPFCITAPTDPRLPGGGGYQVCGLYDIKPARFGQADSIVAQPSDYGKPVQVSEFFGVNMSSRFASGLLVTGGVDTGRIIEDNCFVVDSPQALYQCRVVTPFHTRTQVKLQASYPLPRDVVVSAVFQNTPGPLYRADYAATNAEIAPSLGRNLAACGTRTVCTSSVTVPLLIRDTYSEARRTQLDLRVSKVLPFGSRARRLRVNLDIYNALNSSDLLSVIGGYGPTWRQPAAGLSGGGEQGLLGPRLFQISGDVDF